MSKPRCDHGNGEGTHATPVFAFLALSLSLPKRAQVDGRMTPPLPLVSCYFTGRREQVRAGTIVSLFPSVSGSYICRRAKATHCFENASFRGRLSEQQVARWRREPWANRREITPTQSGASPTRLPHTASTPKCGTELGRATTPRCPSRCPTSWLRYFCRGSSLFRSFVRWATCVNAARCESQPTRGPSPCCHAPGLRPELLVFSASSPRACSASFASTSVLLVNPSAISALGVDLCRHHAARPLRTLRLQGTRCPNCTG